MVKKRVVSNFSNFKVMFLTLLVAIFLVTIHFVSAVEPTGASINAAAPQTAPNDTASSNPAYGGNITRADFTGYSTTRSWQGYFGNVTGTIQLADSNDKVLYNWTLANPEGEVYASTNSTITWGNIQCFNYTSTGTLADDTGQAGATSRFGINLTTLETRFNMSSDDVDGVNETFTLVGAGTHDQFFTASRQFDIGECWNSRIFSNVGLGESNKYEEVLLYEPATTSLIFTAIIEETSVLGYDGGDNDFEMLVLENGHGTDTAATTYYFFVELE